MWPCARPMSVDFDRCKQMIASIEADLGRIDVIVNRMPALPATRPCATEQSQWRDVVSINLESVFKLVRPALNGILERGYGQTGQIG